jgi:hypothetical protein
MPDLRACKLGLFGAVGDTVWAVRDPGEPMVKLDLPRFLILPVMGGGPFRWLSSVGDLSPLSIVRYISYLVVFAY